MAEQANVGSKLTNKGEVLIAVKARLIASVSYLNDVTCVISMDPEPPENYDKNQFVTISMPGGNFDLDTQIGAGDQEPLFYSGHTAVTIWSKVSRLDRKQQDEQGLLEATRGLFRMETEILKALAGHWLQDDTTPDTLPLLTSAMFAVSDSDPRSGWLEGRSSGLRNLGDLQMLFSTNFVWDIS